MKYLLLVDDDKLHLRSLERALRMHGGQRLTIFSTTSPMAAAVSVELGSLKGAAKFDALLTDFNMPDMSGLELALAARDAGIPEVMIMTGDLSGEPGLEECGFTVLRKPIDALEIVGRLK